MTRSVLPAMRLGRTPMWLLNRQEREENRK